MPKLKQYLVTISTVLLFILFAAASKVNKIHYGAFHYNNLVEDPRESGNYLVKEDGTKIPGTKITWKSGLLVKDQIKIDDQKFKISEIRGYREGAEYWGRLKNVYIKRIVHGKINVYVQFKEESTSYSDANGNTHTRNYTASYQYSQIGESGPLEPLAGQGDIKKLVADCPLALEMASLSNGKMRRAIKKNRNYLNDIFDVYNNGCKPK